MKKYFIVIIISLFFMYVDAASEEYCEHRNTDEKFLMFDKLLLRDGNVDTAQLEALVEENPNIVYRVTELFRRNLLHCVACHGSEAAVNFLIAKDVPVNETDASGQTALHLVRTGRAAQLLINAGADIEAKGKVEGTPLHEAALQGYADVVKVLINEICRSEVALINAKDGLGRTPLFCAKTPKIAQMLIQADAQVNIKDFNNFTPLHEAVIQWGAGVVEELLRYGASVNAVDVFQQTPLHWARSLGVVELLVRAGADINAKNDRQETPLYCAALVKCTDVASQLLALGAIVDGKTEVCLKKILPNFARRDQPSPP